MRSWLFIPGDSEKKLSKIDQLQADVYIIDLEDSVMPPNKAAARQQAADFLRTVDRDNGTQYWVRVNAINHGACENDLEVIMDAAPDGIVLPKVNHPDELRQLARRLDTLEMNHDLKPQSTRLLPLVTETPGALFSLGGYTPAPERLLGLTWGAEDLMAAIGANRNRDDSGHWTSPFQLARNLCLFAAHSAGVFAIDTICADFRDEAALMDSCLQARRDGFTGKLAIHPNQVEAINEVFTPSTEEIERAKRIVDLFAANPDAGVLALDGEMLDLPHLVQARKLLESLNPPAA